MKRIVVVFSSILVVIGLMIGVLYYVPYRDYKNQVCNVDILGYHTSGKAYDEVNSYLQSQMIYKINELSLKDALSYDFSNTIEALKNVTFTQYIKKDYELISFKPQYNIDDDKLKETLEDYNKTAENSKNARYEISENEFVLIPEEQGNKIDIDTFTQWLNEYLYTYQYLNADLTLDEFYVKPDVTSEDLKPTIEKANLYATWVVAYNNDCQYSVDAKEYITIKRDRVMIDDSFLSDIVDDVYTHYTTIGAERKFKTNSGEIIDIKGGTWGRQVWKDEELKALTEAFYNHENLTDRTPIYAVDYDEIGDTYIEVSIKDQHCWVYEDGECIMETDVVTGTQNKTDTPTGIYYVLEKVNGKYLVGDTYRTWVNKWMRLTWGGVGLHDAYWRGSFGDDIYKYNGSHGCINLPKQFAYDLYDISYKGMPVIVY